MAARVAPELMPTNMPSSRAARRAKSLASFRSEVEAGHALVGADLGELLRDGGEGGARADADQYALLAGGAAGKVLGVVRLDLDDSVQQTHVHDAGDEAGAYALNRMRAGRTAGKDGRKRGLDGEDLQARPGRL